MDGSILQWGRCSRLGSGGLWGGGGQGDGTSAICESLRSVDKEDLPMSPLTPNQRWWPPNSADLQAGALLESSGLQAAGCNRRCGIGVNTEKLQGF